jgi:O-antigen/teichoic acid export membrane protein
MTPTARIARLSAAFLGSNLARAVIGFGLSFALARALGAERFGRWIFCTAAASTLTVIVDLGFGVLLTRDGARPGAEPGRLLGGALVLRLALAMPLALMLYAGAGYLSSEPETIAGLRIAALLGTAGAAYGCFGALYRSQPARLPAVLAIETGFLAAQLLAAVVIVRAGAIPTIQTILPTLMTLAVIIQVAQIVTASVCWHPVFGSCGRVHLPSRDALATLLLRALPFAASGIVANVQTRIGPLMLGYLSTSSELGLFAAASRFGSVARMAPQAVFAGALPVLSHEHGRDREAAERVFHTFDRVLIGGAVAGAIACAMFAAPVLRLVYGPSFAAAAPALFWISVGLVPLLSNSGGKVYLYASGGESAVVRWSAVALVIQAAAGIALIPTLGGAGAAMAIAMGEAVIWWPLRKSARTAPRSSPRRAPASTLAPLLQSVPAALDPQADR